MWKYPYVYNLSSFGLLYTQETVYAILIRLQTSLSVQFSYVTYFMSVYFLNTITVKSPVKLRRIQCNCNMSHVFHLKTLSFIKMLLKTDHALPICARIVIFQRIKEVEISTKELTIKLLAEWRLLWFIHVYGPISVDKMNSFKRRHKQPNFVFIIMAHVYDVPRSLSDLDYFKGNVYTWERDKCQNILPPLSIRVYSKRLNPLLDKVCVRFELRSKYMGGKSGLPTFQNVLDLNGEIVLTWKALNTKDGNQFQTILNAYFHYYNLCLKY